MRGETEQKHQVVQPGGCRLNSCCADLLTEFTHACVLNTRSECEVGYARACVVRACVRACVGACMCVCACVCVWSSCKCECPCLSVFMAVVGQALGALEGSPYLARLLQLSRRRTNGFPRSPPLHTCPHPDLTLSLFPDVLSSKAKTLAPVQLTLAFQSRGSSGPALGSSAWGI